MKNIDEIGEVIATDVLIIGGGLSGILAAIKAKECSERVLVVDKGGIGWAGQMPITAGGCMFLQPDRVEKWFKWLVEIGGYLNNQDWTYLIGRENYRTVIEMAELGAPFLESDGEITQIPLYETYSVTRYQPAKIMINLKKAAVTKGVKTLDKIYIVDLLKRDKSVCGAIGFGLIDGKTYIFESKATILANGNCQPQSQRQFVVNTGEGIVMAFRAGAELMNAEFGNNYVFEFKAGGYYLRSSVHAFCENALGERFMEKYYPEIKARLDAGQEFDNAYQIANAIGEEVKAGRGPIYIDFRKLSPAEKEAVLRKETLFPSEFNSPGRSDSIMFLRKKCGLDPDKERIEVMPQLAGMAGPVRVDLDCKTTADGLWAVGNTCYAGSGWCGAVAMGTFPGWGVPFAVVSGFRGGLGAGRYALSGRKVNTSCEEVNKLVAGIMAPLNRKGEKTAREIIQKIQEALVPLKYNLNREAGRLNEALHKIEQAKHDLLKVGAKDHHELYRYYQAESIALCSEWSLTAALIREESRGSHRRQDYPNRNDRDWLKWIVIRESDGIADYSDEAVPIQNYRLRP